MGQCYNCPRLSPTATVALTKCCMDVGYSYTLSFREERDTLAREMASDTLMLRIPGRSAARGEVTHKKFADMNRKERRAFLSGQKR